MPYKAVYPGTSPYDPDDEVDFSSAISGMYETSNRKGALELKIDVDKTRRFYKALRFISGTVTNPDNALWTETATSAFFRSVKGSVKVTSSAGAASVKASVTVTLSNGGKRNGDVKIVLKRSAGKWVCDVTISIEGRQKTFNSVAKKSDHFRDVTLDIDYVEKVYWPTIELRNYKGVGGKMKERKLDLFSVFEDAGLKLHYNEEDSQEVKDPTSKTAWTKGDMYVVMEKFFQENTSSDDNIWCLQATQPPDSRYMGYSFDQDGKHGFGIFTGHKSFTGLESSVTKLKSEASRRFLHYMAHECGHCMGLRHPFEEGNPNSLSWMNYAWKYDSKFSPGSFYQNFKFSFSDKELEILRHQPDQLFRKAYKQESHKSYEYQSAPKSVVPDFTGYANEEDGEVPPSSKIRKLQFDIKFRSKPYTKGDVVEFEAILKNVGKLPIKVETDLTPGGGVLTVYVTDPFGNVQIVKPFVHGISAPTRSYTTVGKPGSKTDSEIYSETIPLVQSSHGSLFKSEGKYHVKALYDGGSVKATSKSVPLVIEADDDNDDDTNTEVRIGAGLDGNVSQSFSKLQSFWENLSKKPVEAKTKRFQTIVMLLQGLGVGSVKVTENGRSGRRQKRKPKMLERTDPLVSYSKLVADTDDLMKYYETSDDLEASNYSQLAIARGKILMQLNDQERADREYNQMISTLVRKEEEYGFVKRISTEWESVRYPEMQKEKKADVKYYQSRVESLINWVPDDRSDNYDDASGIGLNNAFNGFDTDHREKAETFISELERMEEETDDLDAVLDYADARQRSREVNDIMYRYVIEAYMVHSKLCKKNHVRYPDPPKMDPSVMQSAAMTGSGVGVGVPEELWMNYWRCDADFNFHHNHWHAVYRGSWDLYYRQGELFGYMHAQMLARYDADRESWGLDPVKEYKFDETEPDGFDAGFEFHNKYGWMVPRPKEQVWPQKYAKENQENEKKIWKCFDEGLVEYDDIMLPMDTNIAGHIIEASSGNFRRHLGSFHNMGHMAFCYTEEMKKKGRDITTYMGSPLCAVRDPIFFRWHKHVDNLYQYWNNKVKTDLKENAPPVIIDPCDVIMVPGREMPKDFEKWGGKDWMKTDFSNGEIQTTLKKAELAFEWDYKLGHEEFTYFLRLKRKPGTEDIYCVGYLTQMQTVAEKNK